MAFGQNVFVKKTPAAGMRQAILYLPFHREEAGFLTYGILKTRYLLTSMKTEIVYLIYLTTGDTAHAIGALIMRNRVLWDPVAALYDACMMCGAF
jgi:hypothetical protein